MKSSLSADAFPQGPVFSPAQAGFFDLPTPFPALPGANYAAQA